MCKNFEDGKLFCRSIDDLRAYVTSITKQKECDKEKFRLQQQHLKFLTSQETLSAWVTKSIVERTALFHRSFPDKFIKLWRLHKVYQANLVKKKVIRVTKMPEKKQDGRYDVLKSDMVSRLQSSMKRNRKIIWLDEVMFSKTSALTHAWSKRLTNV